MLFNSLEFLIFFPIVAIMFFVIPQRFKRLWLLVASYYFYMSWNARYGILILACTVVTYFLAILIDELTDPKKRDRKGELYVFLACLFLIGALAYYKYAAYFVFVITKLILHEGISISIVLPVGISFFTFQSLGYVIDVYRGKVKAKKNFIHYALFISFFPQLVAGPIERSGNLLHQLEKFNGFNFEKFREGLVMCLWGFFLKLVVADRAGLYVDYVYNDLSAANAVRIIIATVLFAFQIYGDFGGYSSIAIGVSRMLGIDLMENFNAPYYACSVADFWRRWHISLNTWFRDYLYIPLGGNRKGKVRKVINQLIVFSLSGLWHGASITFVMWGLFNGIMVILSGLFENRSSESQGKSFLNFIRIVSTFILVDFAWMFFRAQEVSNLKKIFNAFSKGISFNGLSDIVLDGAFNVSNMVLLLISIIIVMIFDGFKYRGISIKDSILQGKEYTWSITCGLAIVIILVLGIWGNAYTASDFIYFQF